MFLRRSQEIERKRERGKGKKKIRENPLWDERGQIILFVAIFLLLALFALLAVSIDIGIFYSTYKGAQQAGDIVAAWAVRQLDLERLGRTGEITFLWNTRGMAREKIDVLLHEVPFLNDYEISINLYTDNSRGGSGGGNSSPQAYCEILITGKVDKGITGWLKNYSFTTYSKATIELGES